MKQNPVSLKEILEQPAAWDQTIHERDRLREVGEKFFGDPSSKVFFTGCGSSYYLALSAAAYYRRTFASWAYALPASEFLAGPDVLFKDPEETKLVCISRSGETTETVLALKEAVRRGVKSLAVTCYGESTLPALTPLSLVVPAGAEESVVMTKSFTSMLLALYLAMNKGKEQDYARLKDRGTLLIDEYRRELSTLAEDPQFTRFIYLGTAERYGLAREGALKVKEMAICDSEAFVTLEYRHGPISLVDEHTLVFGLPSPEFREQEQAVFKDARRYGGKVIVIGEKAEGADIPINLPEGLSPIERILLPMPIMQMFAYFKARAKDINPDHPQHLTKFVELPETDV